MPIRYEKEIYQFLSVYRFLAYGLAVLFSQVGQQFGLSGLQLYIVMGMLGIYTILKVFSPLRWREKGKASYFILAGDFVLSMLLVTFSGGLSSHFLLYSLTPIVTAALLFEERTAIFMALGASVVLFISHTILAPLALKSSWIIQDYNLTLFVFYTLFSIVSAIVPFRINLNIRRRIEGEAIVDERRRIAGEIHDGIAQWLAYINMRMKLLDKAIVSQSQEQMLSELAEIRKTVEHSYDDIRESIDQLGSEIREISLIPALTKYAKEFGRSAGIASRFDAPRDFPPISPTAELQLFRIAQELLTNVRKHAHATEVRIRLEGGRGDVRMTVKDNGKGFAPENPSGTASPGYHGLNIIRERAASLGGTVDISSKPGQGTEVSMVMPLEKVRL